MSCLLADPALDLAEQRVCGITAPSVLLRRLGQQVGRNDPRTLPPDGEDGSGCWGAPRSASRGVLGCTAPLLSDAGV